MAWKKHGRVGYRGVKMIMARENHGRENYCGVKMIMAWENHGRENYRGVKKDIGSADEHVIYNFTWLWNKETRSEE